MTKHAEAMEVLAGIRDRLADRLADEVLREKDGLLDPENQASGLLGGSEELDRTAAGLHRLAVAIAALETRSGAAKDDTGRVRHDQDATPALPHDPTFDPFLILVEEGRLEEASHELLHILQMPLDRMITATRFFARAVRVNPKIKDELPQLRRRLARASSAQVMSILVHTFGFQAVESRMAIQALGAGSDRARGPSHPAT